MSTKFIDTHTEKDIMAISQTLIEARISRRGLKQYPGQLPKTLETAYRVQDLSISKWPDQIVGWKVGGIPPHLQAQYQNTRLCGPIYANNVKKIDNNKTAIMPVFENGYAAVEAEFIIELGDTSTLPSNNITEQQAREAIEKVYIGAEIASSPIQNINDLGPAAPISDFGNNTGMIIGPEIKNWQALNLSNIPVTTIVDGTQHGPVKITSELEGPIGATKFLIEHLKQRNYKIDKGTYISSGAITGIHDSVVGSQATLIFTDLGTLNIKICHYDNQE